MYFVLSPRCLAIDFSPALTSLQQGTADKESDDIAVRFALASDFELKPNESMNV